MQHFFRIFVLQDGWPVNGSKVGLNGPPVRLGTKEVDFIKLGWTRWYIFLYPRISLNGSFNKAKVMRGYRWRWKERYCRKHIRIIFENKVQYLSPWWVCSSTSCTRKWREQKLLSRAIINFSSLDAHGLGEHAGQLMWGRLKSPPIKTFGRGTCCESRTADNWFITDSNCSEVEILFPTTSLRAVCILRRQWD